METIPKSECQNIGFFRKTHGIHGSLILEFEPQFEFSVEEADRFFVELDGLLVPFFIKNDGLRFRSGNSAIVDVVGVENEKYAKRLIGNSVYLYKVEIIDDEEQAKSQWDNYLLIDKKIGKIGTIMRIDDFSGNLVLTVEYRGRELMVPFNEELLIEINDSLKTIKLQLPDGLIED